MAYSVNVNVNFIYVIVVVDSLLSSRVGEKLHDIQKKLKCCLHKRYFYVSWSTGIQLVVSFAPVFHYCCLTQQGSPGISKRCFC